MTEINDLMRALKAVRKIDSRSYLAADSNYIKISTTNRFMGAEEADELTKVGWFWQDNIKSWVLKM